MQLFSQLGINFTSIVWATSVAKYLDCFLACFIEGMYNVKVIFESFSKVRHNFVLVKLNCIFWWLKLCALVFGLFKKASECVRMSVNVSNSVSVLSCYFFLSFFAKRKTFYGPKLQKILQICRRSCVNYEPGNHAKFVHFKVGLDWGSVSSIYHNLHRLISGFCFVAFLFCCYMSRYLDLR